MKEAKRLSRKRARQGKHEGGGGGFNQRSGLAMRGIEIEVKVKEARQRMSERYERRGGNNLTLDIE